MDEPPEGPKTAQEETGRPGRFEVLGHWLLLAWGILLIVAIVVGIVAFLVHFLVLQM